MNDRAYLLAPPPRSHSDYRIRRGVSSDASCIQSLAERSFATLGRRHYSAREIETAFRVGLGVERRLLAAGRYVIAETDHGVVGCAAHSVDGIAWPFETGLENEEGPVGLEQPVAVMRSVFVDPDHAGCGLGRRLVAAVEEDAREAGMASIFLISTLSAVAFYESCGYHARPVVAGDTADGVTLRARPMHKSIRQPSGQSIRPANGD